MAELTTGKVIALIRALSTSSTSSATYTVTDALVIGAATTSGVRLDLESGALAVREGDDSAYAPLKAYSIDLAHSTAITRTGFTGTMTPIHGGVGIYNTNNTPATLVYVSSTASGSLTSGASYTFTGALPAGAVIIGVSARITTTVTGPTSLNFGDGSDADRYGVMATLTSGQTMQPTAATASPLEHRLTAGDVVVTAVGGNFTAGNIRLAVHYLTGAAPST